MATFSDLSTQLKVHVFSFIDLARDKAAVCLVSHNWRDIMAPVLWESLDLNCDSLSTTKLRTLMYPNGGVIRHVRRFFPYQYDGLTPEALAAIELIINTLPENTLRAFRSPGTAFSSGYLIKLFQRH
jgi:hypothetical protein